MSNVVKYGDLTIEQMRQLKGIKLPTEMNKIINTNTYYRILNNSFKFGPQFKTLEKLAKAFNISVDILKEQIENQKKEDNKLLKK